MIKPYYENEFVTLYHGNCLEIMPVLDMKFDLLLTDPPYGIGESGSKNHSRSCIAETTKFEEFEWDGAV